MNPFYPRTIASGDGGTITTEGGATIGQLGAWQIQTYGDDTPFLTARACDIARIWCSAGVQRAIVRPQSPVGATIRGEVKLIERDKLNLGALVVFGIAGFEGAD